VLSLALYICRVCKRLIVCAPGVAQQHELFGEKKGGVSFLLSVSTSRDIYVWKERTC